jgi:hypothetical protein
MPAKVIPPFPWIYFEKKNRSLNLETTVVKSFVLEFDENSKAEINHKQQ